MFGPRSRRGSGGASNERGDVAPRWKSNLNPVFFAFCLVVLLEPLSQPVRFDTRDGILGGIERGLGTAKDFRCDVVLGDLVDSSREIPFCNVAQEFRKSRGPRQSSQHTFQLCPF